VTNVGNVGTTNGNSKRNSESVTARLLVVIEIRASNDDLDHLTTDPS